MYHLKLLLPSNPLLAIFEIMVENKPEMDNKGVRKD